MMCPGRTTPAGRPTESAVGSRRSPRRRVSTQARLWDRTLVKAYLQVNLFKREVDRVVCDLDRLRRERLLPSTDKLEKLTRYEAHLSRQLGQALHDLQRLQAGRSDVPIAPPAVLDVIVSGPE